MWHRADLIPGARGLARRLARPAGAAALAAVGALVVYLVAPPGGDAAAHLYQTQLWTENGWQLWDNLWYAGRYNQVNYSLLFYPLAALIGVLPMVVGSVAAAAAGLASLLRRLWPGASTAPTLTAALVLPLGVLAGTYPFLLGLALAIWSLAVLVAGHRLAAVALAAAAALAHPLALLFLAIALAAAAAASGAWWREWRNRWTAAAMAAILAAQAVAALAFASGGRYPFEPETALAVVVFCVGGFILSRGVPRGTPLRATFAAYGVLALAALAIPSPLGGNVERLLLLLGAPLVLIPLAARNFRPRAIAAAALGGVLIWQALPAIDGWRTASAARAADEAFWAPVLTFLDEHHDPNYRVEVVATADNWEAYHLASRGVPLARGWFRQNDFPKNAALYERLTPGKYRTWLRRLGVQYVFLPDDPLDRSARGEAALLRAGAGLTRVTRVGAWQVFRLDDPTPIATPKSAIEVLSLTSDRIVLRARRPGRYRLRVSYTPYWRIERGEACAGPSPGWGTELRVQRAGVIRLGFGVRLGTLVGAVLGSRGGCGPPVHGPPSPLPPPIAQGERIASSAMNAAIPTAAPAIADRRRDGGPADSHAAAGQVSGNAISPNRAMDVTLPLASGSASTTSE